MFGVARVYTQTIDERPLRVLDLKGTLQSATYLDEGWCDVPFHYLSLYDVVFSMQPAAQDLLMLGGGGYAFPKHVIAHHPEACIEVVEIDPAITRLAHKYFLLDRLEECYHAIECGRLVLVESDALAYVRDRARADRQYDAILNDCFAANKDVASLAAPEALRAIRRCLSPHGIYLVNVITALEGDKADPLMHLTSKLSQAFDHVGALPCRATAPDESDNVLVFASAHHHDLPDAINLYDRIP